MLLRLHHHEKIHGMHSGQQNLNMFLSDWSGRPFRYPFYRDYAFDQASYDDFLKDEDLNDLMFVGIDLARNLFIGFIKDGDYDRFSILNSYVSEYDKLCKTIAILYLFNFLAEADKISRGSNSDFNGLMSKANFFRETLINSSAAVPCSAPT